MGNCLNCGKELNKGQTKYCSNACQKEYEYKEKVKKWQAGELLGFTGNSICEFVRRYMLEKANYKCEKCGWGEVNPVTKKVTLEIHHKDGDYTNNKEDNLEVLCPNCHSLTPNYRALNKESKRDRSESTRKKNYCIDCGVEISIGSVRCKTCEGKRKSIPLEDMPVTREDLKKLIRTIPFTQIGKQFNVTDNAIKKWCDKFNLPRTKRDINSYSDEEWEQI